MRHNETFLDSVLRVRMDDDERIRTEWDADGVQTSQRPYTAEENADADQAAWQEQRDTALRTARREMLVATVTSDILDTLAQANLALDGVLPDEPWSPPTDEQHGYPVGWTVRHAGRRWRSTVPINLSEPGAGRGWTQLRASRPHMNEPIQ